MSQEQLSETNGIKGHTIVFDVSKEEEGSPQKNLKKLVRKLKQNHKVV